MAMAEQAKLAIFISICNCVRVCVGIYVGVRVCVNVRKTKQIEKLT